jgi:hypothetical protein
MLDTLTLAPTMTSTSSPFSTTPFALRLYASMYLRNRARGSVFRWLRPAAVTTTAPVRCAFQYWAVVRTGEVLHAKGACRRRVIARLVARTRHEGGEGGTMGAIHITCTPPLVRHRGAVHRVAHHSESICTSFSHISRGMRQVAYRTSRVNTPRKSLLHFRHETSRSSGGRVGGPLRSGMPRAPVEAIS